MRVLANGLHVNCQFSGPEDAPLVVLSHSLASSGIMWEQQVPELVEGYRVLRYDTRGHGGSDAPAGPYSLDTLGDDVIAMLDALDVERVHWVGISMGGMIGQNLAMRHPRRLSSAAGDECGANGDQEKKTDGLPATKQGQGRHPVHPWAVAVRGREGELKATLG